MLQHLRSPNLNSEPTHARRSRRRAWLIALGLALATSVGATFAEDTTEPSYSIVIERPFAIGHQMEVSARRSESKTQSLQMTGREAETRAQEKNAHIEALEEIVSTNAEGTVTAAMFTVRKSEFGQNQAPQEEVFPPGTAIVASRPHASTTFTKEGQPLEGAASDFLRSVISLPQANAKPSEEEVFGSKEKRQIGEQWPIDPAMFSAYFKHSAQPPFDFKVDEANVTLSKQGAFHGVDCLYIDAEVRLQLDAIPGIQAGAEVTKRQMTISYRLILPVDPDRARMGESLETKTTVAWTADIRGKKVNVSVESKESYEATFLKAAAP